MKPHSYVWRNGRPTVHVSDEWGQKCGGAMSMRDPTPWMFGNSALHFLCSACGHKLSQKEVEDLLAAKDSASRAQACGSCSCGGKCK